MLFSLIIDRDYYVRTVVQSHCKRSLLDIVSIKKVPRLVI